MGKKRPAEERFWEKVDRSGGPNACWKWTAGTDGNGYGQFYPTRDKVVPAHRFAYELMIGPIPAGLELDHVKARGCTSKRCVNPAHLEPVTHRENTLRGNSLSARRARQTHCIRGHPFDEANTLRDADGSRRCRACHREEERRRKERKRLAASCPHREPQASQATFLDFWAGDYGRFIPITDKE